MSCRGFDDELALNLDYAIRKVIDEKKAVPNVFSWYKEFWPKEGADDEGCYENPSIIAGNLNENTNFAIEFHAWQTTFFINDIYIGNLGGHFEAWFLTLEELLVFDKYDYLFMLLLPMTGIEEHQRSQTEQLINEKLKQIEIFKDNAEYIAKCMTNGLVIDRAFTQTDGIGLTSSQNHSVRNIEKYPRYKDDVIALNKILREFLKQNT